MKKYCIVSTCCNSNLTTPDKLFITVPTNDVKRRKWLKAADLDLNKFSNRTKLFCCEDHFDLENDAENWLYLKLMKPHNINFRIVLKKGVIPWKYLHSFPLPKFTAPGKSQGPFVKPTPKVQTSQERTYPTRSDEIFVKSTSEDEIVQGEPYSSSIPIPAYSRKKTDFENYGDVELFKRKGTKVNLRLKKKTLPTKFDCQTSRPLMAIDSRKSVVKGQKTVQKIFSNVDNLTNTQRSSILSENSDFYKEDDLNTHVVIKEEPFDENFEIDEKKPDIDFEAEENPICDIYKETFIKQEPIEDNNNCYNNNNQTINSRNNKSKLIANKSDFNDTGEKDFKKIDTLVYNIKKNFKKLSPKKRTTLINSLNDTMNEFMKTV